VGDAREDWAIVRALSEILGKPLPYNTIDEVRGRLADVAPHFAELDSVQSPIWLNGEYFKVRASELLSSLRHFSCRSAHHRACDRLILKLSKCSRPLTCRAATLELMLNLSSLKVFAMWEYLIFCIRYEEVLQCLVSANCEVTFAWEQAFKDRAGKTAAKAEPFSSSIENFFQTDVISRTSINMAKCVQARSTMAHS